MTGESPAVGGEIHQPTDVRTRVGSTLDVGPQPIRSADAAGRRIVIFWLQIAYLAILIFVAWSVITGRGREWLSVPDKLGSIPTAAVWFGAVGGVLISLVGVHEHRYDWDPAYWTWHVARPFVGAVVAVVAVLILQAGILAIGVDPAKQENTTKDLFYYLVAFVVGYREETFRGLVKRLGDVVLTSADQAAVPIISSVEPSRGPAAGGYPVSIKGSDLRQVQAVRFGTQQSPRLQVVSDGEVAATAPAGVTGTRVAITLIAGNGSSSALQSFEYD